MAGDMKTCRNNLQGNVNQHLSTHAYTASCTCCSCCCRWKLFGHVYQGAGTTLRMSNAKFEIYAQVAGQLTNKHINQFIDLNDTPIKCVFVITSGLQLFGLCAEQQQQAKQPQEPQTINHRQQSQRRT